jgi:hypothetical protein
MAAKFDTVVADVSGADPVRKTRTPIRFQQKAEGNEQYRTCN